MESLLAISIALLAGLLMTRVLKLTRLNLPDVTAFLIAGLLVGPYCLGKIGVPGLGFTSMEAVDSMSVISNTALGFIAFAIGNEFRLRQFWWILFLWVCILHWVRMCFRSQWRSLWER